MRDSEAPEQPLLLSLSLFRLLKVIKPLTVLAPPPPPFFFWDNRIPVTGLFMNNIRVRSKESSISPNSGV